MPCCCCVDDMANIVLFGTDASEKQQYGDEKQKMILERVAHSFRVFETLTAHLQRTHKLWRKQGRVYKRKVEQVRYFFITFILFLCFVYILFSIFNFCNV